MFTRAITTTCALALALGGAVLAQEQETKVTTVTARAIKLQIPESWKAVRSSSSFRLATFQIAGEEPDAETGELVVYYFGGPTGGVKANIERWVGQFHADQRKVELTRGKSTQGRYYLADISGTWKKPDGPPFAQRTIDTPGSRVIGVVLIAQQEDQDDYYFLKFSGPDALIKRHSEALRTAFGADAKSEEPLKLEDAEN